MNSASRLLLFFFLATLADSAAVRAQQPATNAADTNAAPLAAPTNSADANGPALAAPATNNAAVPSGLTPPAEESVTQKLQEASKLSNDKNYAPALEKLDSVLLSDPRNITAYSLRGYIYSQQKDWDKSEKDFEAILQVDPKAATAQFDLSELKFLQQKYDDARVGFATLEQNTEVGDLAAYKAFLCDLLAGHTHVAAKELSDFNDAATHPSYYFSNAAWELYNKRPEEARHWLDSAGQIYYPYKVQEYTATLNNLGYLPLPPPPPGADTSALDAAATTNAVPETNATPVLTPNPAPAPGGAPAPAH